MFAGPPVHESGPSAEPARVCLVRSSGPHVSFPSRCLACRRRWVVAHGRLLLGWVLLAAPRLQTLQFKAQCRPLWAWAGAGLEETSGSGGQTTTLESVLCCSVWFLFCDRIRWAKVTHVFQTQLPRGLLPGPAVPRGAGLTENRVQVAGGVRSDAVASRPGAVPESRVRSVSPSIKRAEQR